MSSIDVADVCYRAIQNSSLRQTWKILINGKRKGLHLRLPCWTSRAKYGHEYPKNFRFKAWTAFEQQTTTRGWSIQVKKTNRHGMMSFRYIKVAVPREYSETEYPTAKIDTKRSTPADANSTQYDSKAILFDKGEPHPYIDCMHRMNKEFTGLDLGKVKNLSPRDSN